ncbi:flagellar hook-associated protein FlgK [Gluconacetobacter sacchari DSM 12717]|uniref:Flagellar hook-associated protein 1 n=2 Tax=Gluconacetobacter sacchari TaxID=92759 RepID=A0A7W4I9E1_9PROT|nr:flagellar basal body rod C-terminal domain-containing protein [Gluconacetobacter sacchari]MBB2158660.1 flagellar hook-associated protein FlgK [Gluconacetobacter sacchari]GBQ18927.1 flagellar hook-associated protein FlgK [Gluconacetobacter sacchari DSM 12717]
MDLLSSLSIATSGLNAIEYQYGVTSQNVSNQSTTGYVSETATVTTGVVGGIGNGVRVGATQLNINQALQSALYAQNAQVASDTAMDNSLTAVSAVQGSTSSNPGSTNTLADQLGNVQSTLTSLIATPSQSVSQTAVIADAQSLAGTIHTLASTYATQRQNAEDSIASTIPSINSDLTQIGVLSQQIVRLKTLGTDTADLENQRLGIMSNLSSTLSVTFSQTANGDMIVRTADGTELPTRPDQIGQNDSSQKLPSTTWPLGTTDSTLTPDMYYSGSGSSTLGIMLNGKDITTHLTGGTLGANITLRDVTYPTMQAQLDSFSYTLVNRFNNAGLPLFTNGTDATGTAVPQSSDPTQTTPAGIIGLSSAISVNTLYTATPSLLTTTTTDSMTGKTSAATSVATGTATGDTTIIQQVLNQAFGTSAQYISDLTSSGGPDLAAPTDDLGPDGTLSTGYTGQQGLLALATALTSNQGATIAASSNSLAASTSVQTVLAAKVADVSGVNVNDEMAKVVALQNAYTANAKIVAAVQTMFTALLNAVN